MTLLEDLELAVAFLRPEPAMGDVVSRLEVHAYVLRTEMRKAEEKARLPHSQGRTKALLERINNGSALQGQEGRLRPGSDEGAAGKESA